MKKISKFFFLTNFLKGHFKAFPEKQFFSKKHFFVFCRKFGFNLEKLSNHYSQVKKQVKVDLETRSYDFLTKTREKNPMLPNIRKLEVTLGLRMIEFFVKMCFADVRPVILRFKRQTKTDVLHLVRASLSVSFLFFLYEIKF